MSLKNTEKHYGLIAIVLHWTVALCFLALYASVYYRHWFTERGMESNKIALHLHLSFGISVMVFIVLRIIWKSMNTGPAPVSGLPAWQHKVSTVMHWALYAVMIYMPITGYLGTGVGANFFFLFELPKFADTSVFDVVVRGWLGMTFEEFEAPIDFIHKKSGAWLVWMLIMIHAGAALYHHFVQKDAVLRRMLTTRN